MKFYRYIIYININIYIFFINVINIISVINRLSLIMFEFIPSKDLLDTKVLLDGPIYFLVYVQ